MGEKMETVADFIFLGSKIIADSDCSHEINKRLLLGRKATKNIESILKSRNITLPTKVSIVKAMVFPIVMYGCELDYKEGWLPKNWCFQTVVLEKTLESPLDSKPAKSKRNLPWIFIARTKLQSFRHMMQRANLLKKTLRLAKIEGEEGNKGWDG